MVVFFGLLVGQSGNQNQNQNQNQNGSSDADAGILFSIVIIGILIGVFIYWIKEDVIPWISYALIPWISYTLIPWLSSIFTFGNFVFFGFLCYGIFTLITCIKMIKNE